MVYREREGERESTSTESRPLNPIGLRRRPQFRWGISHPYVEDVDIFPIASRGCSARKDLIPEGHANPRFVRWAETMRPDHECCYRGRVPKGPYDGDVPEDRFSFPIDEVR